MNSMYSKILQKIQIGSMKITVTDNMRLAELDVDEHESVENIKALIEVEFGIPSERQKLYFNMKEILNNQKLSQAGVTNNSLLLVSVAAVAQQISKPKLNLRQMINTINQNQPNIQQQKEALRKQKFLEEAKQLKQKIMNDQASYAEVLQNNEQLSQAIFSEDINVLANYLMNKDAELRKKEEESHRRFIELSKDPMNPEYQRLVQQHIQKQNIQSNLEHAREFTPEVFGQVCMLYINAKINKVPIQAFVDSGAQSTIMSKSCAERCNVLRLVDTNYAGTAVGVGTSKIIGRVHAAEIEIEGKLLTCSLTVIENDGVDFLLGLDMLKRFSCVLDLKKSELNFQDGLIVTKFLPEGEIKKAERKLSLPKSGVDDNKVRNLQNLGFGKQESIDALKQAGGNQEIAAGILTQKRFGM